MNRNRGFSLVEIAMVVAIALILLSLGLTAINSQLSSAAYSITKKRQDVIKDALANYLGARRSFPCPYVPIAGTAATGIAPPQTGAPLSCPSFGAVPYVTLGLGREAAEDGWGNLFSYHVYSIPANCPFANGTDWANANCFGAGKTGALNVVDGTVAAATPPFLTNAIVMLVSHGANGLGAWVAMQGTRNANPVTCEEAHNAQIAGVAGCVLAPNKYYKGESQSNDDVVAYLTANDAILPLAKQGILKSAVAQVNIDLQDLYDQAISLNTSGSTCGMLPATLRDPWGNQYTVLSTPASDPLFCLSSTGGAAINPSNPTPACLCASPVFCKPVTRTAINLYRNRASNSTLLCP